MMWEHNLQLGISFYTNLIAIYITKIMVSLNLNFVSFEGIEGGKKLGVEPLLKAKDMADHNVEHLGVMAYAAFFQWVKPRPQINEQVAVHIDSTSARIHQPVSIALNLIVCKLNKFSKNEFLNVSNKLNTSFHQISKRHFSHEKFEKGPRKIIMWLSAKSAEMLNRGFFQHAHQKFHTH